MWSFLVHKHISSGVSAKAKQSPMLRTLKNARKWYEENFEAFGLIQSSNP